jgi:hypothetical protein
VKVNPTWASYKTKGLPQTDSQRALAIACPKLAKKLILVSPGLRGFESRDPWVRTQFADMLRALEPPDLTGAVEVFLSMRVVEEPRAARRRQALRSPHTYSGGAG